MNPRTKLEQEVLQLSAHLPDITTKQVHYAYEHCFPKQAVKNSKNSNKYICLECGAIFDVDSDLAASVIGLECPCCGKHLKTTASKRTTWNKDCYTFQIITTKGGFQVTRTFHVIKHTRPCSAAIFEHHEVVQVWQHPEKRDVIVARPLKPMTWYVDGFDYSKPMSIRHENETKADYRITASVIYPRRSILPILKRNGYSKELKEDNPTKTFDRLLHNPHYETLAKMKRFDIWHGRTEEVIHRYWKQIKMIMRHGYYPTDFGLWEDTLRMAERLGEDTMAAKYVMPANLKAIHDVLMRKQQKIDEQRAREETRKEARKNRRGMRRFRARLGKLLAVCITDGDIEIRPLQNRLEFIEEGKAMHHCVATYFEKRNSFILSVRQDGVRIATVELDIHDFSIQQCRAACNAVPERYDEICNILTQNKPLFQRLKRDV